MLCTNPSNLGGGSGVLNVIQPSAPFALGSTIALGLSVLNWKVPSPATPFWSAPGSFTAQCTNSNGAHVLELLITLNRREKTTLVLVTHDHALTQYADRIVTLRDGAVISDQVKEAA